MSQKPQQLTMVRTHAADIIRMDRLIPKLEKLVPGSKWKRPGIIAKALNALEREIAQTKAA